MPNPVTNQTSDPSREDIFSKICDLLKPYNPQKREIKTDQRYCLGFGSGLGRRL